MKNPLDFATIISDDCSCVGVSFLQLEKKGKKWSFDGKRAPSFLLLLLLHFRFFSFFFNPFCQLRKLTRVHQPCSRAEHVRTKLLLGVVQDYEVHAIKNERSRGDETVPREAVKVNYFPDKS